LGPATQQDLLALNPATQLNPTSFELLGRQTQGYFRFGLAAKPKTILGLAWSPDSIALGLALPPNPRYLIYFLYSSYFFIFKKIVIYSL
jgi:hypothetical protein